MDLTSMNLAELRDLYLELGEEDTVDMDRLLAVREEIDTRTIKELRGALVFAAQLVRNAR